MQEFVEEMSEVKREFLFFEWVMVDNCNLLCPYCVNKGEFSHKSRDKMVYSPGQEIEIANRIVDLSVFAERVKVNLTGGEPLMAERFEEALNILAAANNVSIQLISNLRRLPEAKEALLKHAGKLNVHGSLHINLRTTKEIDKIVCAILECRDRLQISLSQVDCDLSLDDRLRVEEIEKNTGLPVHYQTFIPPWTAEGKVQNGDKICKRNFVSSSGRRCCLGYSHFFLNADGVVYGGLWCNSSTTRRMELRDLNSHFLLEQQKVGMRKCPNEACGCNYNVFDYDEYTNACDCLGYPDAERMSRGNTRKSQRSLRHWSRKAGDVVRLFSGFRKQSEAI
jgi:organic radical activating enzyme